METLNLRRLAVIGDTMMDVVVYSSGNSRLGGHTTTRIGGSAVNFARAACPEGYDVTIITSISGNRPTTAELYSELPCVDWRINRVSGESRISHFTISDGLRVTTKTTGDRAAAFNTEFLKSTAIELLNSSQVIDALLISGYVVASAPSALGEVESLFTLAKEVGVKVILDFVPHNFFTNLVGRSEARRLLGLVECAVVSLAAVNGMRDVASGAHMANRTIGSREDLNEARSWLRSIVPSGIVQGGLNGSELNYWWSHNCQGEMRLDPRTVNLGEVGLGDRILVRLLPQLFGTV
jgi:sugar/nucleoside kinase (ribokinase family)